MDTTFFIGWALILGFDGILMGTLTWAATSQRYGKLRAKPPQPHPIEPRLKVVNTQLNNVLSLSIFAAFFYFLGEHVIYAGLPRPAHFLGEVLGALLLYDFMYYFFHRLMHARSLMRYCHAVHHRVRSPLSNESIFLNPLETLGGVSLMCLGVTLAGPVSAASFLAIFFIYSTVNIIVHSNLVLPHPALRLFNFWVETHNVHHQKARNNYASIFPFWDQLFGTAERGGNS
jgi:sterol desaturase/sphingolipid hydroxylase (fatty acid hydroxylase superfamily)